MRHVTPNRLALAAKAIEADLASSQRHWAQVLSDEQVRLALAQAGDPRWVRDLPRLLRGVAKAEARLAAIARGERVPCY